MQSNAPMDKNKKKMYLWSLMVGGATGAIFFLNKGLRDSVDLSESASSAEASRNYWERYREQIGPIILPC